MRRRDTGLVMRWRRVADWRPGVRSVRAFEGCAVPLFLATALVACSSAVGQTLRLDGTPTCFRALQEISEEYSKERRKVSFQTGFGGSFWALERLGKREIDVAFIEYPLRRFVDRAWNRAFPVGKEPARQFTFAQTALGVLVNEKNAVKRLTEDQVRDILTGKVTSWA